MITTARRPNAPTPKQVWNAAYRAARDAGLSTHASRLVADSVAQRVILGGETYELVVNTESIWLRRWKEETHDRHDHASG